VNFPKTARAHFSHALERKVKKIIRKNLAVRQSAEGGSARRGEAM
jgi:hypothetical protein